MVMGCAQVAPRMFSPAVYSSSRDAVVEENKAYKEKLSSKIAGEKNAQKRAAARQIVAINEINGAKNSNTEAEKKVLTADGILGGFPAIIINDSACNTSGTITQIGGDYDGTVWSFNVKANGGRKEMKLESQNFLIKWSYPPSDITHPTPGEGDNVMSVHDTVRYIDDRTKKQYHGGYIIKGRSCY